MGGEGAARLDRGTVLVFRRSFVFVEKSAVEGTCIGTVAVLFSCAEGLHIG
ncbi:hypothetical protein GCM10009841_19530 [Microlunatus panaciterrae]